MDENFEQQAPDPNKTAPTNRTKPAPNHLLLPPSIFAATNKNKTPSIILKTTVPCAGRLEEVDLLLPLPLIHRAAFRLAPFDGLALVLQFHHPSLRHQQRSAPHGWVAHVGEQLVSDQTDTRTSRTHGDPWWVELEKSGSSEAEGLKQLGRAHRFMHERALE